MNRLPGAVHVDDYHGTDDQRFEQALSAASDAEPQAHAEAGPAPCQCGNATKPCRGYADREDLLCALCREGCLWGGAH